MTTQALRKLAVYAIGCSVRARYEEIARGAIEANLDITEHPKYDEANPDEAAADGEWMYESCFVLAFEALRDVGCNLEDAREIAGEAARRIAQP